MSSKHLTQPEIHEIRVQLMLEFYKQGYKLIDISRIFSISQARVTQLLSVRPEYQAAKVSSTPNRDKLVKKIIELRGKGLSLRAVAKKVGLSHTSVDSLEKNYVKEKKMKQGEEHAQKESTSSYVRTARKVLAMQHERD